MTERKKEDLEVVKKAEDKIIADDKKAVKIDEAVKNSVPGLKVHTVKLPPEPKIENKKSKNGVRNADKKKQLRDEKGRFVPKGKNRVQPPGQENGKKTKVRGTPAEARRGILGIPWW